MPTLNHQVHTTFTVILLLAVNGRPLACVTVNAMILIWIMSANLTAACVVVRLKGAVKHRFLAHPGRLREGERIGNCLSTTGNPHRRVLDGKQPLALLFLLLCPHRRCLLFNLLDFADGVTRNISQFWDGFIGANGFNFVRSLTTFNTLPISSASPN